MQYPYVFSLGLVRFFPAVISLAAMISKRDKKDERFNTWHANFNTQSHMKNNTIPKAQPLVGHGMRT